MNRIQLTECHLPANLSADVTGSIYETSLPCCLSSFASRMWLSTKDVMGWMSAPGSTTMLQTGEDTVIHYTQNGTQHQGCDGLDVHTRLHRHAANRRGHSHTLHTHNGTQHQGCDGLDANTRLHHHAANRRGHSHALHTMGFSTRNVMGWMSIPGSTTMLQTGEDTVIHYTNTMGLSTRDVMGWMSTPGSAAMLQTGEDTVIHYTNTMGLSTRDVMGWMSIPGSTTMLQTGEDTVIHYTQCDSAPGMWWAGCPYQAPPPCCKQERTLSYTTHKMGLSTRDVIGWMSTPGSAARLQTGEDTIIHYTHTHTQWDSAPGTWWAGCPYQVPPPCCKQERTQSYTTHTMWLSTRDAMGWMSTPGSTTMLQTGEDTVIHYTHNVTQHQGRDGPDVHTRLHHHAANRRGHSHALTHNVTQHQGCDGPDVNTRLHHHAANRRGHSHTLHTQCDSAPGTQWAGCPHQAPPPCCKQERTQSYTTQTQWDSAPEMW